jgi:hypothetical protein
MTRRKITMFKKYENEHLRASVAESRHGMLKWLGTVLLGFLAFLTLVGSITYYNVQALKVPVKYEHSNNTNYERGN